MSTQYDKFGSAYTKLTQLETEQIEHYNFEEIIKPIVKDAKLLDLACGLGRILRMAIDLGAAQAHGVDISPGMIEGARATSVDSGYKGKTSYEVGDCSKAKSFEGSPYDIVTACWLVNYAPDSSVMTDMFRNASQNLRSGGRFIGVVPPPTEDPAENVRLKQEARPKQKNIVWTETTGFVEEGIKCHVIAMTEENEEDNVQFDCYHLKKSVHEKAAKAGGFAAFEFRELKMPEKLKGKENAAWLEKFVTLPECGIFVATKA